MRFGNQAPLIIVAVLIVLGWWGISLTRSLPSSEQSEERDVDATARLKAAVKSGAVAKVQPDRGPASLPAAPRVEVAKPIKFQFQTELNTYAELKAKVLPSPEEKAAKSELLKNASFLRSLADRLNKQPLMAIGEQDVALDLLVDALQNGDKDSAEAAIGDIVADKQVEDASLATPVREQLAGIKAELLYHWTAFEPDQASQVGRILPGPVSRKIWNNVTQAQRDNLAESQAEANR